MFVEGEWKTILESHLCTPDQDSNLNLPVISSLVYCALDYVTTKADEYNVEEMDDSDCEDVPLSSEKVEDYEHKALYELACGSVSYTVQRPICTWDLLETFTMNPKLLPSHTVNSMNLARVLSRLHHNSYEDMDEIGS
uniref:Uncharacterized protein n=1 Tax=Timema douglasi TaxID=61478 RepID=A0A7R8VH00_TIMDO|nr:unnamed protein product [Timema douglasi]